MDRSSATKNPQTFALWRHALLAMSPLLCLFSLGCYAPIHSPGIAARTLPDEFRWPIRTSAAPLNYSQLVGQAPDIYLLGTGDKLQITAPDLIAQGHSEPFEVQVLDDGEIYLPRLGPVAVGGLPIAQAQQQVNQALANGLLTNPNTVMTLKEKGTVNILVLGAVKQPGVHTLPRDENDVAHALAAAQGFSEDAGDVIEIHRRGMGLPVLPLQQNSSAAYGHSGFADSTLGGHSLGSFDGSCGFDGGICQTSPIVRIPLRGENGMTNPSDVILNPGDVLVIPQETAKVFYVVGPLSERNSIRFSTNDKDREIGGGLLLPDDREIDVVTAVAMAGYIDPIESPTTVTVHRRLSDRSPLLIRVDLLAARSDPQETVTVQAGDIIYLNPDVWWYSRRSLDRIIDRALGTAVGRWLTN